MSKLSSPSLPPAPFACALHVLYLSQLCHLGPAAARVLPPAALLMLARHFQLCSECCACLAHLPGNATCSCWAVPSAEQQTFTFFNPPQKPRNLYQLTQLLATVLKAEVQEVQAKFLQLEGIVLLFILEAQMQLILVFGLLVSPIPRNEILALCM